MNTNDTMFARAKDLYKKVKGVGIAVAILMIIMGIVMFLLPATATTIAMWLMVSCLLIDGIGNIIIFFGMPKGTRSGWSLAVGIIWIIIAITLISGGLNASFAEALVIWGTFEMLIGFMVGFTSIFDGIETLCLSGKVGEMGGSKAGCIIAGILELLVGIIVLTYPIGAVITLTVFYGLFIAIFGVSMLCRILSNK